MKKMLTYLFAAMVVFSITTNASAHTHLESSTPADGTTVEEAISQLTLQFDGKVGEGSFIELTSNTGNDVAVQDITISDKKMTATIEKPLANGTYIVDWSIISADGHPLEGSYEFIVQAPVTDSVDEEETTVTEEVTTAIADDVASDDDEKSSTALIVIAIILAVIIIVSLVAMLKRKN